MTETSAGRTGFARPPAEHQFKKGKSGNPRGRPRNSKRELPYDHVLGQMVTVREDGRERRITAAEAFLLQLTKKGLGGDSAAAGASLAAIENARAKNPAMTLGQVDKVVLVGMGISSALPKFGLAVKHYRLNANKVRLKLEPWIVQEAVDRFGDRKLTEAEQREVWAAVQRPEKVRWPDWWTVRS